jgi:hypothetical protein
MTPPESLTAGLRRFGPGVGLSCAPAFRHAEHACSERKIPAGLQERAGKKVYVLGLIVEK